jgi:hypothetical protein
MVTRSREYVARFSGSLCAWCAVGLALSCSDGSSAGGGGGGRADGGGSPADSGSWLPAPSVMGSYGGAAFNAKGVGMTLRNWQGDGGGADVYGGVSFMITQNADPCLTERDVNDATLTFYLRAAARTLTTGDFPVSVPGDGGATGPAPDATVKLVMLHAGDCGVTALDYATAGKVTLSTVTTTMVEGSFDVTFASSGRFTGTFAIQGCYDITPGNYLDPTLGCVL